MQHKEHAIIGAVERDSLRKFQSSQHSNPGRTSASTGSRRDPKRCANELPRNLPLSLLPLQHWRLTSAPKALTGVSAVGCHAFVNSMRARRVADLEELPSLQHVDDELPYAGIVSSEPNTVAPKKYRHPILARATQHQGWVCQHTNTQVRIVSPSGDVLHSASTRERTYAAVRKEILELEMLIKGVVIANSTCTIVKFQDEINQLKTAADKILSAVPCFEQTSPDDDDCTGLRRFHREYESALAALWTRRTECMEELQKLEREPPAVFTVGS